MSAKFCRTMNAVRDIHIRKILNEGGQSIIFDGIDDFSPEELSEITLLLNEHITHTFAQREFQLETYYNNTRKGRI